MKNYIIIKRQAYSVLLLVISFAFCFTIQAQEPLYCPEPKVSEEQLARMLQYRKTTTARIKSGTIQVRVFAHIVADDDGTRQGATPDQILSEISTMKNDFAPGDICFIYVGFDRINNTLLNNINVDTHDDEEALFGAHLVSKCLNIFYTHQIRGTNAASGGGFGGITFNLPTTWCIVTNGSLGGHTSSHETGHCFGLFHTFDHDRYGYENINGDDCDGLGDIICDTHADPYAYRAGFCYSESGGFYTGFCSDPNGQSNFDPPYNNIMSYWHHDPESFTLGQTQAMDITIANESILSALLSVDHKNFGPVAYNYQQTFISAKNSITTVGSSELTQLSQTALFANKLIINIGFHAKPDAGGYTLIRVNDCNGAAKQLSIAQVQNGQTQTNVISNRVQQQLKVYPNPAINYFIVQYNQPDFFDAVITVRNSLGIAVYTMRKTNIKELNEKISMTGKAKGVYLIELNTRIKRMTNKIIIQ